MARAPDLIADQAEVVFLLDRFRRAGLFTQVIAASDDTDGDVSSQDSDSPLILP